MGIIPILLLADTHLGFDLPFRPRIKRRRRGPDFFANFERALMPARPMIQLKLHAAGMNGPQIQSWIQSRLYEIPADSLVKLKLHGKISAEALAVIRAPALRVLAPFTMNIEAAQVDCLC
jgi:hypothetical protein